MRTRSGVAIWAILFIVVSATACERSTSPLSGEPRLQRVSQRSPSAPLRATITPALADQMDSLGRIRVSASGQQGAEIEPTRARELALVWVKQFGPFIKSALERGHGGSIQLETLVADDRVFFAHSAYADVSDRYSRASAKGLGAYYLVTLTQAGTPAVTVAVSARASDIGVANGRLIMPKYYGNEFRAFGIPTDVEYPITPERAVRIASEGTGALVKTVPILVAPAAFTMAPQYARWKIVLDRKVALRQQDVAITSSDTVYVDWSGKIGIPTPGAITTENIPLSLATDPHRSEIVALPPRNGYPRHFNVVFN